MHEEHQKFLSDIAGYDYGIGGCTLQQHEMWIESLKCKVLRYLFKTVVLILAGCYNIKNT